MREARQLTRVWSEKRRHPIRLAARVPTLPDAARGLGMDGVAWAREGLVDMLIPTPFWATTDFDISVELWRQRLGAAGGKVVLAPGAEILLRAYPAAAPIEQDLTSIRGFAAACLHRGADRIYLFNYMDPAPMAGGTASYRTLLREGLDLETVIRRPRRHVATYRDTVAPGLSQDLVLPINGFQRGKLRLYTGPAPKDGPALIVAGLAKSDAMAASKFEVTINGAPCVAEADLSDLSLLAGVARAVQHRCPAGSVRDGYNDISIRQLPGAPEQQIVWLELRIPTTQAPRP
jgi:hypothetical protein